ncbi:hypothetical protein [Dialister invisus]|jgi:hypothetical protein|uniref:hypothetical protein n=1 Tax=Dialister invisus TaxID=218538 RepID=UPI00033B95D6|nr:hypothetical protein [Dialister invisus]MUU08768.1 hypothetical protein [Dialister invisus]CCZ55014.1 putative uncharacterized protein [Dialister invisus CAG:218]
MPGDKLKRVKSVKRWLDKAENSYSNNKDISGELNLMMAQAEMQRLKETHPHEKAKKWGIRLSAMAAAAVLFIGFSNLFSANADKSPVISRETTVSKEEVPKVPEVPEDKNLVLSETVQPAVAATESSNTDPVPTKSIQTEAPAPVLPVMSQSEIQSVVGEAGRALRGQS